MSIAYLLEGIRVKMRAIPRFFLFITALLLSYNAFAFGSGTVRMSALPLEAQQTILSIQQGGPFPYEKDGSVFGNYEKVLPQQKRGYYREFTVKTPRARNRGARRIITGGSPPREYYYTADHYRSFHRVIE
ncbi:MAG TPA: ribonuclease [Herminiimonas sp.]|nr:ribonuclease [Herminiimonas sp.]